MKRKWTISALLWAMACGPMACQTKTQSGALIGGLGGAALGAAIGSNNGSAGGGALIGGAAGAIGGGLVGNGMDRGDAKARRDETRAAREPRLTRQDVMNWSEDGVSDEIIIDRIERSGEVFRLTARDENTLRDRGVSEDVIGAMKDTDRRSTRAE